MAVMSIGRVFGWLAEADGDAVAVRDDHDVLTRRQLDERSDRVARRLRELGVGVDDIVTIGLPSTVGFVVLCAAVWKAGGVPQPLSPRLPVDELREIVALGRPALVVGFAEVDLPGVQHVDAVDGIDGDPLPDLHATSWKAPVSGGSTGRPKIILSGTPATVDPTAPTVAYIPARAVQLVTAPLHHGAPFLFAMRGLFLGHTLVLLDRFDAATALRRIEEHAVTWALFVPTTMQRITDLGDARDAVDVSSLEAVLHLGSACPQWLKRDWIAWLGPDRVVELYAGTESTGVTLVSGRDWLDHPGTVGRPAPGTSLRILDEQGRPAPTGEVGTVYLRPRGGPGSTYRYVGAEAQRVDGFESLGDLGWVDDDGFLYLADRAADVITVDGAAVYPAQVEAVVDAHPDVRSTVAIGLPVDGRTRVHLIVDVAGHDVDPDQLLRWAADRLDGAAVPASVELVDEPLRDDAGKARRSALRAARTDA